MLDCLACDQTVTPVSRLDQMPRFIALLLTLSFALTASADDPSANEFRKLKSFSVPEAHQAVAVDSESFYAIGSRTIARYDKNAAKSNPKALAKWSAPTDSPVRHLNSGIVLDGRLYCANSNWPKKPLKNTVEIFRAATLKHLERKEFPESEGAINWIERHQEAWWIVFAFYGEADVRKTRLVRYNDQWRQTGVWTFPETVIQRFLPNSNSGGAFGPGGRLFVTGHDHAELYVLHVGEKTGELIYQATVKAPIAGQGIAWERIKPHTLYGIVRRTHEVVTMRQPLVDE
jgi:outer membrane protein assembly factor BamB